MNFRKLAMNNLKRSPVRAILTSLSVVVSAASLCIVLSLDKGYTSAVKDDLVTKTGVHMYVTKEGCPIEAASVIAQGGLSPLFVSEDIVARLEGMPEIEAILPFKLFTLTTSDGTRTDIFMGITEAIKKIRADWTIEKGGWFEDSGSVILGFEIARQENLSVGERIYNENLNREFRISGILKRNYSQDDGSIFLPLHFAQKLVDRERKLSAVAIKVKDISSLDETKAKLRSMLPEDYFVVGSKELSEGILQFFGATRIIMFVMVFVAFVVSVFGIINTMLMSVLERRKEIAYLKCVGAGSGDLLKLITMETLVLCVVGSLVGTISGAVLSPIFGNFLRQFLIAFKPSGPIAQPDATIFFISFSVCLAVGLVCAIYPALRAARIVPMEVLRNE